MAPVDVSRTEPLVGTPIGQPNADGTYPAQPMAPIEPMTLRALVKEHRVAQGMTQMRLSRISGVSHASISALESGRKKYIYAHEVDRLESGLNVPPGELWDVIPGDRSAKYIRVA